MLLGANMSRPYFLTHLDHILDLDTIWVLLGILVPKNTSRATSWSHLPVQKSRVKVSARKILAIERGYRIGGFFRPKKVWFTPGGGNDHSEKNGSSNTGKF